MRSLGARCWDRDNARSNLTFTIRVALRDLCGAGDGFYLATEDCREPLHAIVPAASRTSREGLEHYAARLLSNPMLGATVSALQTLLGGRYRKVASTGGAAESNEVGHLDPRSDEYSSGGYAANGLELSGAARLHRT